jgi:hypothetical protein
MRKLLYIPVIAVLSLALASPAVADQRSRDRNRDRDNEGPRETERVDRTATIRAGGKLRLNNFSGRVTITGSNRGDVAIHAIRRATRERLDRIKLEVTESGSGVSIEANKKDYRDDDGVVDTEFDIQVPADISLDVEVFSSDVIVKDVRGSQKVHTFSGEIELSGGESSINAETFSGDINVKLVNGASARVDFDSFSGDLRSDVPMSYRGNSRKHVSAEIGAGGTDYHFKTFSGDVRIK